MGRVEGLRYLYLFLSPLLAGVKAHGDCCGSCEAEGIGLCGHCGLCECEAPPPPHTPGRGLTSPQRVLCDSLGQHDGDLCVCRSVWGCCCHCESVPVSDVGARWSKWCRGHPCGNALIGRPSPSAAAYSRTHLASEFLLCFLSLFFSSSSSSSFFPSRNLPSSSGSHVEGAVSTHGMALCHSIECVQISRPTARSVNRFPRTCTIVFGSFISGPHIAHCIELCHRNHVSQRGTSAERGEAMACKTD